MFRFVYAAAAFALLIPAPAQAWGPLGHRVSAIIAEANISGYSRAQIKAILGPVSLAEASTIPDEQRQNPDPFWQGAASWHRTLVDSGKRIAARRQRDGGDSVEALQWCVATLRDAASEPIDRQRALAFAVHLVADTHLPVHFNAGELGGGDFQVSWFGEPRTMHWAFEEGLPLSKQMSASEYAAQLMARTTSAELAGWWTHDMAQWMDESIAIRETLYAEVEQERGPMRLDHRFVYRWQPVMELRLQQSGYRTAAFLDWIFAGAGEG